MTMLHFCHLLAALDAADLAAVAVHEAVRALVELLGAVVDRRQAREALGRTPRRRADR